MIRPEFTFHRLNREGIEQAKYIAQIYSNLLDELEKINGPAGREMAIVRTKLEEASFFSKKALAVQKIFQESVNE